jgi:radical SAM superfamily enzyme YgiQ (UPF0313 family)
LKILLVYPKNTDTFWSFKHALKFISKKAAFPPLGLLTVAAMLPSEWKKKLVDMNITSLKDKDIRWADYVFISAMVVQQDSTREVIDRCKKFGIKTVGGGPLFTPGYDDFKLDDVDHIICAEAENIMPRFVADLKNGTAKHMYNAEGWPDISTSPVPLWSLINMRKYQLMSLQYSRGCPFNCEFCDIVVMNGHIPRTKNKEQVLAELNAIYDQGWRGSVFFTDDNFIGNKRKLKAEILPAMAQWNKAKNYPYSFFTEVSINLADDEDLMQAMTEVGFNMVFVGIESPNEESLVECNKMPNKGRDLLALVKKLQNHGFQVQGGFIVGFDSDPLSIFRSQINFIQNSGIVTAMVGVLMAPPRTALYNRLKKENRLLPGGSGDNTDGSTNFIPKMGRERLTNGYRHILRTIYSQRQYNERIKTFLKEYKPRSPRRGSINFSYIRALFRSMWVMGIWDKGRRDYWRLFIWTLLNKPRHFPMSITFAIQGLHFRKVAEKVAMMHVGDLDGTG